MQPIGPNIFAGVSTDNVALVESGLLAGEPTGIWLTHAAARGSLSVLKAAHAYGYEMTEDLHAAAATNGRTHVLDWFQEIDVPATDFSYLGAITAGSVPALDWLHAHGYRMTYSATFIGACSQKPDVVEWVVNHS